MALSNYTELKAAVLATMHRPELTSEVVDFITLAESRINAALVSRAAEIDASLTATISSRYIALPSGFASKDFALWDTTNSPRLPMVYLTPEVLPVTTSEGQPRRYTIDGSNIAFEYPCQDAYTYTLRYKKRYNIASTTTNDILTNYPGVYLYGALVEGAIWTHNDEKLITWGRMYDTALTDCINSEAQARGNATLVTEFVPITQTNILSGGF